MTTGLKAPCAVWVALAVADSLTTVIALHAGGVEGNPIQAWALRSFGSLLPGSFLGLVLLPTVVLLSRRVAPRFGGVLLVGAWLADAARAVVVAFNCVWLWRGGLSCR